MPMHVRNTFSFLHSRVLAPLCSKKTIFHLTNKLLYRELVALTCEMFDSRVFQGAQHRSNKKLLKVEKMIKLKELSTASLVSKLSTYICNGMQWHENVQPII